MRKIKNPWKKVEGYNCFGCNPDNPLGLHMEFYEEGEEIISFWKPRHDFQGWVNTMHGGILSALIDETAGWVVFRKLQTSGVTARLDIRYKKPVMVTDTQITLRARITGQNRRLVTIEVKLENAMGEVCTEGTATYYVFDKEKAQAMGFAECGLEKDGLLPL